MSERTMPEVVSVRAERPDWFLSGVCRFSDLGPDAWFPVSRAPDAGTEAKDLCWVCPVRQRCLNESLAIPDVGGIWGGWGEHERRLYAKASR